jgi:conjugal transfer pilus assembly protein TraV
MIPRNATAAARAVSATVRLRGLLAGVTVLGLGGCSSFLSGIGGTPTYACKAPEGAQCTSVSGVYANAGHGPRQPAAPARAVYGATLQTSSPGDDAAGPVVRSAANPGGGIRSREGGSGAAPPSRPPSASGVAGASTTSADTTQGSASLRSSPRILRLWIAPWEDSDGDLHEASTVNVLVDHGRWLAERVRPSPKGPRMGVAPPAAGATPAVNAAPGPRSPAPADRPSLDQPEP